MERAREIITRKRRRAAMERTSCAPDATGEASAAATLQALLNEVHGLREEQRRTYAEFSEAFRQRDVQMQRLSEGLHADIQLSPPDNITAPANACVHFARPCGLNGEGEGARGERVVSRGPQFNSGVKLKPDTFDGSVPLKEFVTQFELIARANCWTGETKTAVLVSCLRGKARAILESVQNLEILKYEELKSKLELRFGETHSLHSYYSQFTNRKQRFGENVALLGSDIERLSQLAYPECPHEIRDKVACAQFVSALSDRFVKRTLQLEGVTSLKIAIERAKTIKMIQENSFEQKRGDNFNSEKKEERKNNNNFDKKFNGNNNNNFNKNFNSNTNFNRNFNDKFKKNNNNKKSERDENRFENKKRVENKKECWECGKQGHFRFECPGKMENKD